jgi:hypothetical protein
MTALFAVCDQAPKRITKKTLVVFVVTQRGHRGENRHAKDHVRAFADPPSAPATQSPLTWVSGRV